MKRRPEQQSLLDAPRRTPPVEPPLRQYREVEFDLENLPAVASVAPPAPLQSEPSVPPAPAASAQPVPADALPSALAASGAAWDAFYEHTRTCHACDFTAILARTRRFGSACADGARLYATYQEQQAVATAAARAAGELAVTEWRSRR